MGVDGPGDGNYASIDPAALKGATDSLQKSVDGVNQWVAGLISGFGENGIDTTHLNTLKTIAGKIAPLLPELRRRQSLAEQLVAETPQNGKVAYFQGDLLGSFKSVSAATAQAHIDAEQVKHAVDHGDKVPQQVYDDLGKYGSDPDYSSAFVKELGSKYVPGLLLDAENWESSEGEKPDQKKMAALSQTFATASYRVNFDSTYLNGLTESLGKNYGLGLDSLKIFTPLLRNGTWSKSALENIADDALSGPAYNGGPIGGLSSQSVDDIFRGLANNPLVAADYYSKHQKDLYKLGNSELPVQPTMSYIDFLHAATIDARSDYAIWALNGGPKTNLAEQNANFLINQVGKDGDKSHGLLEKTYADIGVTYFDDYIATVQSPIDLSTFNNVNWMAVNASEDSWKKFFGAGMKSDQGLLELAAEYKSKLDTMTLDLNTSVEKGDQANNPYGMSANATSWERYTRDQMQSDFTDMMKTLSSDNAKSFADRKAAVNGLVSQGLDWLTDPSSVPSSLLSKGEGAVKSWLGNFITDKVVGDPPKIPEVKITRTSLDSGSNYLTAAIQQYNVGLQRYNDHDTKTPPIAPYNDGDLTWNGDPSLYESPGAKFTNPDGSIKPIDQIVTNPAELHAFQQWLLDPAVQAHVSASPGAPNK
jgi:hypothetical protein